MFHFYRLNIRKRAEPLDTVRIWQQEEHMGCTICSAWKSACFFIHKGKDGAPGLFHPRKTEQCQTAWLEMICACQLPCRMRVKLRQDAGACSQRDSSGREVTPMWQLLFGPLPSARWVSPEKGRPVASVTPDFTAILQNTQGYLLIKRRGKRA